MFFFSPFPCSLAQFGSICLLLNKNKLLLGSIDQCDYFSKIADRMIKVNKTRMKHQIAVVCKDTLILSSKVFKSCPAGNSLFRYIKSQCSATGRSISTKKKCNVFFIPIMHFQGKWTRQIQGSQFSSIIS